MWLRLLYYLGLTNLSDQQVESYYETQRTTSIPMPEVSNRTRRIDYLNTIIGKGSSIEGSLKVQGILRVDGRVKGDVSISDSLVIGKDGELDAKIMSRNVVIGGRVKGTIGASGKVVLEDNSAFIGVLKTAKLVIDEGAVFEGTCSMVREPGIGSKIEYGQGFSKILVRNDIGKETLKNKQNWTNYKGRRFVRRSMKNNVGLGHYGAAVSVPR